MSKWYLMEVILPAHFLILSHLTSWMNIIASMSWSLFSVVMAIGVTSTLTKGTRAPTWAQNTVFSWLDSFPLSWVFSGCRRTSYNMRCLSLCSVTIFLLTSQLGIFPMRILNLWQICVRRCVIVWNTDGGLNLEYPVHRDKVQLQ